jgi:hypothetical protein
MHWRIHPPEYWCRSVELREIRRVREFFVPGRVASKDQALTKAVEGARSILWQQDKTGNGLK